MELQVQRTSNGTQLRNGPYFEIRISPAFRGASIELSASELSASRKYASYAPLKTISGKYQNSNGMSDPYLCDSQTENWIGHVVVPLRSARPLSIQCDAVSALAAIVTAASVVVFFTHDRTDTSSLPQRASSVGDKSQALHPFLNEAEIRAEPRGTSNRVQGHELHKSLRSLRNRRWEPSPIRAACGPIP
jgi:hypothetical protein